MKKILALIMLLVLAFSFAACGGSATPEPTPAPSGGDEPAPEPAKELIIGFNTNGLTNETMSFMVDVMRDYCNKNNIKLLTAEDNNDTAVTINNLENFVSAGVNGIIVRINDPVGMTPTIQELVDKGITVVSYDEYVEAANYSFLCSFYDLGYAIGSMAGKWADKHIPNDDKIVCGLMSVEIVEAAVNRSDGIQDGFLDNCSRGEVFRSPFNGDQVDCWNNMLSARPEMKICASLADAMVTGVAEAWYADLVGAGKDISEYGVFATDATDIALNLVKQAKEGKGIYRGTIDLGLKDRVPLGMIQCCHAGILGQDPPAGYGTTNYYEFTYVTEENIDDYAAFLD
ncbi:MAG: sugar ABC transporter substrate-binding protein [Oscillospiraceae bacterium]|nr:sugar ABC transporter substrate-binding protein [Oscillospiraceae bacterium]